MPRRRIAIYLLLGVVATMLVATMLGPPTAARRAAPAAAPPPSGEERVIRAELPVRVRSRRSSLVRVPEGVRLVLTVRHDAIDAVEIVGLDTVRPVQENTPAVFDLFTSRAGSYPVRLRSADRVLGRIIVGERARR